MQCLFTHLPQALNKHNYLLLQCIHQLLCQLFTLYAYRLPIFYIVLVQRVNLQLVLVLAFGLLVANFAYTRIQLHLALLAQFVQPKGALPIRYFSQSLASKVMRNICSLNNRANAGGNSFAIKSAALSASHLVFSIFIFAPKFC